MLKYTTINQSITVYNWLRMFYKYFTIYTRSDVAAVVRARDAEYFVGDRLSVVALCVQCFVHP